jgi:hypothetical protein
VIFILVSRTIQFLAERRRNKDIGSADAVLKAVRDNRDNRTLKFDVFLSYSSADKVWVNDLYEFLKSSGYRVCYDVTDFPYGCCIPKAIADAVSESNKVIAIVSPSYVKSRWTEMEYVMSVRQILDMEAPRGQFYCQFFTNHAKCRCSSSVSDTLIIARFVSNLGRGETFTNRFVRFSFDKLARFRILKLVTKTSEPNLSNVWESHRFV